MERRFMITAEVAEFLRISPRTLQNRIGKHNVYRPERPGIWHVEHVTIIEKVWMGAWSEDEGLNFWELEKSRHREELRLAK